MTRSVSLTFAFKLFRLVMAFLVIAPNPRSLSADQSGAPPIVTRKLKIERDQTYTTTDDGTDLLCDVYSPTEIAPQAKIPAVIVIHGGAWSSGSKSLMSGYAAQLARLGMVAIAIDYRHAPKHKFPAQVDDIRESLIWTLEHAESLSIDKDRLGLFGYSAGGHLACMIATLNDEPLDRLLPTSNWRADDPRWNRIPKIHAVVAGGPPCEFRNLPPGNTGFAYFLGGSRSAVPHIYDAASPTEFASAGDCPICFVHGERDIVVPLGSSQSLFDAQRTCGVESEFVVVEKQGHMLTFLHPKTSETLIAYMKKAFQL